ncbi:type III polyketide synthase [uncultured Friedmanniella sp.]|uniref:type III polyketide synthase n=1 Tax=uncultured Friedmanniella sp. TaxID=335381 RepID=UPI0035CA678D
MAVSIRSLATVVPETVLAQDEIRDLFARQPERSRLGVRRITSVFDAAAIDTRHTVIAELADGGSAGGGTFLEPGTGRLLSPLTGTRNDLYRREAGRLFVTAARDALAGAPGLDATDVSHVVTVSCTGFYAPGPDIEIVRALGLAPTTQRTHIGFLGCYAAFPALRTAADVCRADPAAVVLVVAVELCTLHLHAADDTDTVLSSSLFADGGAAAVVTARPAPAGTPLLDLDAFSSTLVVEGEDDMAWTIGNAGFDMVLSSRIPRLVEAHLPQALKPLVGDGREGRGLAEIDLWAVHPGGRSILDRVQSALALTEDQLGPSREVLRRYGNMSSATVLFVLRELLAAADAVPATVCALAFGPGVSVESALLTRRTAS